MCYGSIAAFKFLFRCARLALLLTLRDSGILIVSIQTCYWRIQSLVTFAILSCCVIIPFFFAEYQLLVYHFFNSSTGIVRVKVHVNLSRIRFHSFVNSTYTMLRTKITGSSCKSLQCFRQCTVFSL